MWQVVTILRQKRVASIVARLKRGWGADCERSGDGNLSFSVPESSTKTLEKKEYGENRGYTVRRGVGALYNNTQGDEVWGLGFVLRERLVENSHKYTGPRRSAQTFPPSRV